jgi:hypothetical protein
VKFVQDTFKLASITPKFNSKLKFTNFVNESRRQLLEKMKSPKLAKNIQLVNDGVYSKYENLIAFKTIEKEICATILKMRHNVKCSIQKKLIGLVEERMISFAIECA